MDVSENSGTPKSAILIGFSIINHPFWGIPIFGNTHICLNRNCRLRLISISLPKSRFFCQNYIFPKGGFLRFHLEPTKKRSKSWENHVFFWTLQKIRTNKSCAILRTARSLDVLTSQFLRVMEEARYKVGVVKLEEPWIPSNTPLEQPLEIF